MSQLILRGACKELSSPRAQKVLAIAHVAQVTVQCEEIISGSSEAEESLLSATTVTSIPSSPSPSSETSQSQPSLVLIIDNGSRNRECSDLGSRPGESSGSSSSSPDNSIIRLTTTMSMIRAICRLGNGSSGIGSQNHNHPSLFGHDIYEEAIIDSWLSFILTSIDVPLEVYIRKQCTSTSGKNSNRSGHEVLENAIRNDLIQACTKIERHFVKQQKSKRSFGGDDDVDDCTTTMPASLLGEIQEGDSTDFLTCADISLGISLKYAIDVGLINFAEEEEGRAANTTDDGTTAAADDEGGRQRPSFVHLSRWYNGMRKNHPSLFLDLVNKK